MTTNNSILLEWNMIPEYKTLYLVQNLTKEQAQSFLTASERFVNDGEDNPKWWEHQGLQNLKNFMGILTENFDYAWEEKGLEYEQASLDPTKNENQKYLTILFEANDDNEEEYQIELTKYTKQYQIPLVISGWYL